MKKRIYLSPPHMGGEELTYIQEAFESNWVSPVGPHIDAFENELAFYNGIANCAALSSGTAAIHLALIILNVEQGDEVICQTFTFSGSCNPILYLKAVPVFVDSELETWNMDPTLLEEAILDRIKKKGRKPKAIIAVHLYGMPAKMDEILTIAKRYEIPLVEDAAESLGSTFNSKKSGTLGDIGIYSFNGNKIITTSGGGALVSENEKWVKRAKFLATQARDPAPHYQHSEIGYNYRLSNISAGIGRGQLKKLDERIRQKRANFEFYQENLSSIPGIAFQPELTQSFSNRWLTCIAIESSDNQAINPDKIRLALEAENIESRPLWKPMHLQPLFSPFPAYERGVSANLFKRGLCLPSSTQLTDADKDRIISVIRGVKVT